MRLTEGMERRKLMHIYILKSSYPSDEKSKIHSSQLPLYSYTGLDTNSKFQTSSLL